MKLSLYARLGKLVKGKMFMLRSSGREDMFARHLLEFTAQCRGESS